jgi:5-methylcytosine-specific restriction endonuclease McrA
LAKGGSNDMSNLQTLCQNCNSSKGAKFDRRFRRRYQ